MIEIRLPVPPSVNALYFNLPKRGRAKTKEYKDWLANADSWYRAQMRKLGSVEPGPCVVEIRLPAKMRGDVSNRTKAAEDFLVSRLITADDRHNWKVSAERDASLTDHCVITVRAA